MKIVMGQSRLDFEYSMLEPLTQLDPPNLFSCHYTYIFFCYFKKNTGRPIELCP